MSEFDKTATTQDAGADQNAPVNVEAKKSVTKDLHFPSHKFDPHPGTYYKLRNVASGRLLNNTHANYGQFSHGVRGYWNDGTFQTHRNWRFIPTGRGDGSFYIKNQENGQVLNVSSAADHNIPIHQLTCETDDNQHEGHRSFLFEPAEDGMYYIKSAIMDEHLAILPGDLEDKYLSACTMPGPPQLWAVDKY